MARGTTLALGYNPRNGVVINKRVVAMAVVTVAAAGGLLLPLRDRRFGQASLASLVSASSVQSRSVEPRLSGFAWAPFRSAARGESEGGTIAGAIGKTLDSVRGESTQAAQHSEAVAELLAGHPRKALSGLTIAAEQSSDPAVWSDLAAVLHETAVRDDAPELLADALAACDRALAQQPDFPEARFNRAIVIERLGLRDDAREAWERYLAGDTTSGWASEARSHLKDLRPAEDFLVQLDREYDRVKDPAEALALVRRDPFGARGTAIKEVLGRWGDAVLRHDDREAERHLGVARQLGAAVTAAEGDRMLERSVAVIDAADSPTRALLASAHSDFRNGSQAHFENRHTDADPLLRRAAAAFETARSPMVLPARIFAIGALFEQGKHDDAEREMEALLATVSSDFPGYQAVVLRHLGTFHTSRADWGAAITILGQSASLYDQLVETQNAAGVRRLLAFVYDRIGDPATAWTYRLMALNGLGVRSNTDLEKAVASIADAAVLRNEWRTALSFLTLEIRIAHRLHDNLQLGTAEFLRAVVRDRLHDEAGALSDIAEGRVAAAAMKDPVHRTALHVAELRASAMLASAPPASADALLTEAIEYQATQSDPLRLPGLFLERARVRRKAADAAGAMADIQRGIGHLEQHRLSLPEGEARWGAFHAAEELFDEGVDLAMSLDDVAAAFRFAERARARALLDSYGSPVLDYQRLSARTVVVEYVSLPSRLIIFTADRSGVRATAVACPREKLKAEVDAFGKAIRSDQSHGAGGQSTLLYQHLVAPISTQLLGATTVVFAPDAVTSTVAFGALTDTSGQYLVEQHTIVMAPSAALFAAATDRRGKVTAPHTALVIAASEPGADSSALSFANAEARRVARAYRSATGLTDNDAQLDELIKRAPEADVIHFAGHAIGDDSGIEPASMVLRQNGHERRVGVAEIARLRLRPSSVVVLAGCSTARGERRASEGVISVAHGFLAAGAPSVIATLWPINDQAASVFFPRLHKRLAEGFSPAEALRQTQLESIRRGDVPASLWAAVQDIGS